MSRGSLVVACIVVAACKQPKGVQVDGRELIPGDATIAFGLEIGPVRASLVGPMLYASMQSDTEMRAMIEAVQGCNLDLDGLRGFLAGDPAVEDRYFAFLEGPKIGHTDTVRCIENGLAKRNDGRLRFETHGELLTLDQEGGGKLIILNENAMVFANGGWERGVLAAIERPETRNTKSELAKVLATIDPGSDAWIALTLREPDRTNWGRLDGSDGLAAVSGIVDFTDGLKVTANFDGRDAANAKQLEASLRTMLEELKPELADAGLPAALLDGAKLKTTDARATATLEIGPADMPGVLMAVGAMAVEAE